MEVDRIAFELHPSKAYDSNLLAVELFRCGDKTDQ